MAYDILIQSGLIIDGTGNPPISGDIGIEKDKIRDIGDLSTAKATLIINAAGKHVAPGFIDLTNHSDTHLTLFTYPQVDSYLMQGVTTIIGGNCGASLAPLGNRDAIMAISKWADLSQMNINWATFADYLKEVAVIQPAVNFGSFAGYGTLRRGVIGDEIRLLTAEEREKVKLLLRAALREGAYGLSVGLSYGHERISTTEELTEICRVLHQEGGILKAHLRSEGTDILAAVNEMIRIGREAEISIQISHLKAIGKRAWPLLKKTLELIASARSSGLDINFDVSPYSTTGSPLYLLVPAWARSGGFKELFRRIDDLAERKKIVDELRASTLHYEKLLVISAPIKTIVGSTLAGIAERAGLPPEEALLQTIRANQGRVSIIGRTISARNTHTAVQHELSFIGSDGEGLSTEASMSGNLVHPRSFGAFPHFWHKYVMDSADISPEQAIKKITCGPAAKLGIRDRGVLKKGNIADIVVFDAKAFRDKSTAHDPYHYAEGVQWVLVNGAVAVKEGKITGARVGSILRRG